MLADLFYDLLFRVNGIPLSVFAISNGTTSVQRCGDYRPRPLKVFAIVNRRARCRHREAAYSGTSLGSRWRTVVANWNDLAVPCRTARASVRRDSPQSTFLPVAQTRRGALPPTPSGPQRVLPFAAERVRRQPRCLRWLCALVTPTTALPARTGVVFASSGDGTDSVFSAKANGVHCRAPRHPRSAHRAAPRFVAPRQHTLDATRVVRRRGSSRDDAHCRLGVYHQNRFPIPD